ncbi:lipocalin family protein [Verrucomicrobium sp. BvORR034]|uniref:lipocalin family protein n=1 Tax=Verrucomicrobium sp. BvORR034 TaxID=1396418 RepID=UPI000679E5B9|nr:lipocalin family protein [Verrucomicrobium sp. BvORR034]
MKTSTLIFGSLGLLALAGCVSGAKSKSNAGAPPTVLAVDLKRYTGTWYEIARFPHSFEKGASHVTANYLSQPDGTIKVVNRSMKDGKPDSIEGVATPVAGSNGAKLKVKFFTLLPSGNYWVLALDDKNYHWAMVGEGSRKYLWILSRTPQMDRGVYEMLVNRARELGYDVSLLEKVEQ